MVLDIEQANVTGIQLRQSQAQLSNTQKQVDAGALPELNAAELAAQVARDSANLMSAQTTIEVDKLTLKGLIILLHNKLLIPYVHFSSFNVGAGRPSVKDRNAQTDAERLPEVIFELCAISIP